MLVDEFLLFFIFYETQLFLGFKTTIFLNKFHNQFVNQMFSLNIDDVSIHITLYFNYLFVLKLHFGDGFDFTSCSYFMLLRIERF